MAHHNSKKAWRQWFEHAEFSALLDTEQLLPGQNTRDCTITGQGIYCAAIVLRLSAVVAGTGTQTANADVADFVLSNFRIKSQKSSSS